MRRIACPICDQELTAGTDEGLVIKFQQHANQVHNMHMPIDQARRQVQEQFQEQETPEVPRQTRGMGKIQV